METPWGVFEEIFRQFKERIDRLPMVRGKVVMLHRPRKRTDILQCRLVFGSKELGRLVLHQPDSEVALIVWKFAGAQPIDRHFESFKVHAPDAAEIVSERDGILLTPSEVAGRLADTFIREMLSLV